MRIAFSFDDNHTLNMKLADLLEKYGFRATFFINILPLKKHVGMKASEIQELYAKGHEIAAHTVSHTPLPLQHRDQRHYELIMGKKALDSLLNTNIVGFSYPKGQFTNKIKIETESTGHKYARATGEGNINPDTDRFASVPTVQIYNTLYHRIFRIWRNILEGTKFSWTGDWKKSCKNYIKYNQGLIHIWGHSWEIEKQERWSELEDLLTWIKTNGFEVVTLREVYG